MNTSQLECFVQVAENLSFRRAAEALHLAQPTVSKQVASLEQEVGGELFVRTTRQVMLTELGEALLRDVREILRLTYVARERAQRNTRGYDLAIGYSDTSELMRLAPVLDQLRTEWNGLHVLLAQGPRDANVTRLTRDQLDVVLGFETPSLITGGIGFSHLATDTLSCIVRKDSPLAQQSAVGPEDVENLPQVRCIPPGIRRYGSAAASAMTEVNSSVVSPCTSSSEAYCLVDAGFGYALVPSLYTMPDPFHLVLPWTGAPQASYGLYHRNATRGKVISRLIEIAASVYGQPNGLQSFSEVWTPSL